MRLKKEKKLTKTARLTEKNTSEIPTIADHSDMKMARKKLSDMEEQKKETEGLLHNFSSGGPYKGTKRANPTEDAMLLLAGKKLTDESVVTERDRLCRLRAGLEEAVKIAKNQIRTTEARLVSEGCPNFQPIGQEIVGGTITAFEQLEIALKRQQKFFNLVEFKGYPSNLRPGYMTVWPYEKRLLDGGEGLQPLRFHIDNRKKGLELETKP